MISKLTTLAATREQAVARMVRALDEYGVAGVPTTIGFCRFVMTHEAFTSGQFSTHFVDDHFSADRLESSNDTLKEDLAIAAALYADLHKHATSNGSAPDSASNGYSVWRRNRQRGEG